MPTVLITGGHAGIGFECAKQLASRSRCDLVLAGRSVERMEPAAQQLRTSYGVKVTTLKLDTSSLVSVREAAAEFRTLLDSGNVAPLDTLLCNAGGRHNGPTTYSPDGYETTFATNCLGHFLLVELLVDRMADAGRIVFTASGTHDPDTMDGKMVGKAVEPDAIALENDGKDGKKPLSAGVRYSTSKLCTMLYAYELHRRLRRADGSIASIAFDPGSIPETGLLRTMPKPVQWLAKTALMKGLMKRIGVTQGSVSFSGASLAQIAVDPIYGDASGKYLQSNDGALNETRSSKMSYDEQRAAKLWNDSKTLVRLQPSEESTQLR
ncbi:SDR family NAD(P)-dependent oxidoreductase [Tunturibacter empetritectus]|uniref:NAD(P)-dependent dehydrogenase (Short-subunit alcohol dehydrogenase family) n=1 Tax=Tunturiibacter lichenicola TaxID=2051959 RepID=A0A7W8JBI3_9BACT|nr:SDR family NAD(P)-dependent oxidoreductase [Edaphobacter lichenicola]MBB5346224.1 NAD(P)-dependent dehydrogenase (short-subunit alcohol dehydrogenase family) [Edaphobacter lichenicola]